jgi:hypothetical protein
VQAATRIVRNPHLLGFGWIDRLLDLFSSFLKELPCALIVLGDQFHQCAGICTLSRFGVGLLIPVARLAIRMRLARLKILATLTPVLQRGQMPGIQMGVNCALV